MSILNLQALSLAILLREAEIPDFLMENIVRWSKPIDPIPLFNVLL
jgi:hypothetical protein